MAENQTIKKKKKEELVDLNEIIKSVAARNKAIEHHEVDCLEVMAKEFGKEIEK